MTCESSARSIPACAGEPGQPAPTWPQSRVYPRVCGGTLSKPGTPVSLYGLSPRVRGNPAKAVRIPNLVGSIPACAGEPLSNSSIWRVH